MIDLAGHVALVTGSSRGIGRACAIRLAEAGADVIVNYVTSQSAANEVAEQVQKLGRRAAVVKADVSEYDDVASMLDFVKEKFGRLDVLISNAATGGFRPLLETNARNFEAAMNTNVRSLLFLVQAAMPLLERKTGRAKVITLSSHGSRIAIPMYGMIGTSKAALEALVRQFTLEIGDRGVNINCILAGLVDTDSTRRFPNAEEIFEGARKKTMVGGRSLLASDVADAALFLASPLADLVQGQILVVDGGEGIHA